MNHQTSSAMASENFKVAFIGDQGIGANSVSVLQLIKDEGTDMVLHQGDFDYSDDSDAWDQQINNVLGSNFPYFASIGNHDVAAWSDYQLALANRLDRLSDIECKGDIGVNSSCKYKGVFFILSGVGTLGSNHSSFIEKELLADNSIWRICSWHKNMNAMQLGSKSDETGWEVYKNCRNGGAIIATGHEHSYSRTKTLSNFSTQTVNPQWTHPNDVMIGTNSSFAFVSGIAGHSIRNQDRCLPTTFPYGCNGEWANIYTSDQNANYGALFCTFFVDGKPNKANCYFKDILGSIPDQFTITSLIYGPLCSPPLSDNWIVSQDCILESTSIAPANVTIRNNSTLLIPSTFALNVDFSQFNLTVESGSGVLIKSGGKIT
ncbi:MAG: metallophosphoesterase [Nitrosopumilus sp.]|nr:metallophosphoesterase [Nitrosopumilus sp.]